MHRQENGRGDGIRTARIPISSFAVRSDDIDRHMLSHATTEMSSSHRSNSGSGGGVRFAGMLIKPAFSFIPRRVLGQSTACPGGDQVAIEEETGVRALSPSSSAHSYVPEPLPAFSSAMSDETPIWTAVSGHKVYYVPKGGRAAPPPAAVTAQGEEQPAAATVDGNGADMGDGGSRPGPSFQGREAARR